MQIERSVRGAQPLPVCSALRSSLLYPSASAEEHFKVKGAKRVPKGCQKGAKRVPKGCQKGATKKTKDGDPEI